MVKTEESTIDPYNSASTVVLISSYPRRNERGAEDVKGVSSYVENLAPNLKALLALCDRKLVILADEVDTEECLFEQNQCLILRSWKRNSITCFWQIFRTLCFQLPKPLTVLIQFEFNLFGDAATTASLPLFLLMLRLAGKTVYVMIHQVVEDLAELRVHVGLESKPLQFACYRVALRLFYWLVLRLASGIAVHEPHLKERLHRILPQRRICTIAHGSRDKGPQPDRHEARGILGATEGQVVLLCFGFLTHYKGSDWVVQEVGEYLRNGPTQPIRLILAGGETPNFVTKPHYQEFVSKLRARATEYNGCVQITGYIPEERVGLYFTAADLVIFPYRTFMSASGPLAIAFSFGAAFLLSEHLIGMLSHNDIKTACQKNGLEPQDLIFRMQPGGLMRKVTTLTSQQSKLCAMRQISMSLGSKRDWGRVAQQYLHFLQSRQVD